MSAKTNLLKEAGYRIDGRFGTYLNEPMRVVISAEFVNARSAEEVKACLAKISPRKGWQFFCLKPPTRAARKEIEAYFSTP